MVLFPTALNGVSLFSFGIFSDDGGGERGKEGGRRGNGDGGFIGVNEVR